MSFISRQGSIVYTANIGGREWAQPVTYPGYTMLAFSDSKPPKPWIWVHLPAKESEEENNRLSKRIKLYPWEYFDFRWATAIWLDANCSLKKDPAPAISNLSLHVHRKRDCIYEEIEECRRLNKARPELLDQQESYYKKLGHPEHWGLWENGFSIRRNTPEIESLCKDWLLELDTHTQRDQISLPVVLRKHGITPKSLGTNIWNSQWVMLRRKLLHTI
jgi:hypothetical protein